MASLRTHLVTRLLKWRVKRRIHRDTDPLSVRAKLGKVRMAVPGDIAGEWAVMGGIRGERLRPVNRESGAALLYLHGGGYIGCSPQTHRPITCRFARRGFDVFAPDYRLAPEHPCPAAIDDAVAAYRGLVQSGIPPAHLAIAGDSAGGGLAVATLVRLRDEGDALPGAGVLFSPWTDLAGTGASLRSNRRRDAMFDGRGIDVAAGPYLGGLDPRDPRASPLYADLHGLPPLLVHAGSHEVLLDDAVRLVERAQAAGVDATLATWPVVPHVWQLFPVPEARQSLDAAAAFLNQRLTAAALTQELRNAERRPNLGLGR